MDKIHDMVLADRRIKVREVEEAVDISYERVVHILHNELNLKKTFCKMAAFAQSEAKNAFELYLSRLFGGV